MLVLDAICAPFGIRGMIRTGIEDHRIIPVVVVALGIVGLWNWALFKLWRGDPTLLSKS